VEALLIQVLASVVGSGPLAALLAYVWLSERKERREKDLELALERKARQETDVALVERVVNALNASTVSGEANQEVLKAIHDYLLVSRRRV
jgi:hypothetical protein